VYLTQFFITRNFWKVIIQTLVDITTALPKKLLKSTFFGLLIFWKNPGCYMAYLHDLPFQEGIALGRGDIEFGVREKYC